MEKLKEDLIFVNDIGKFAVKKIRLDMEGACPPYYVEKCEERSSEEELLLQGIILIPLFLKAGYYKEQPKLIHPAERYLLEEGSPPPNILFLENERLSFEPLVVKHDSASCEVFKYVRRRCAVCGWNRLVLGLSRAPEIPPKERGYKSGYLFYMDFEPHSYEWGLCRSCSFSEHGEALMKSLKVSWIRRPFKVRPEFRADNYVER